MEFSLKGLFGIGKKEETEAEGNDGGKVISMTPSYQDQSGALKQEQLATLFASWEKFGGTEEAFLACGGNIELIEQKLMLLLAQDIGNSVNDAWKNSTT